jgi:hypothetical protein
MKHLFTILLPITLLIICSNINGQWQKTIIDNNLSSPEIIWVGDLNGDQKPDVVAADFSGDKIYWYENNHPNWTKYVIDNDLDGAYHVRIGDIDGDGDLDVVATGYYSKVIVWYENNHPTWNKHVIDTRIGYCGCFAICDIDSDDDLDVVLGIYDNTFSDRDLAWYENNYPTWTKHVISTNCAVGDIYFGDIDGDGMGDLTVSRWLVRQIGWFRSVNAGSTWTYDIIDQNADSGTLVIADINNDGSSDLLASGYDDDFVRWYENDSLNWTPHNIDNNLNRAHTVIAVDIDSDQKLDVVATGKLADKVVWYKNNDSVWVENVIDANIDGPHRVYCADMDNDSAVDCVVPATETGEILWYKNPITKIRHFPSSSPNKYTLSQNYPNPFNPNTTIEFSIPKSSEVTLEIFNIVGEQVATLVSERLSAGSFSYEWDASRFAGGVYLYQLRAGDFGETKKMVLLK